MKRAVTLLMCAAILTFPVQNRAKAQEGPAILVVFTAVVLTSVVIWVYARDGSTKKRAIVLYKGYLDGNWTPVATNVMVIGPDLTKAFPAFADQMKDDAAFYRVKEIPLTPKVKPGYPSGSTVRPITQ